LRNAGGLLSQLGPAVKTDRVINGNVQGLQPRVPQEKTVVARQVPSLEERAVVRRPYYSSAKDHVVAEQLIGHVFPQHLCFASRDPRTNRLLAGGHAVEGGSLRAYEVLGPQLDSSELAIRPQIVVSKSGLIPRDLPRPEHQDDQTRREAGKT
jgi:hypothetical protein